MAAALIPLAIGSIPGLIGGIMSIANEAKKMRGGRIMRPKVYMPRGGRVKAKRMVKRRRGKGIAADIVSSIPLIGSLAGPLVRALGGRVMRKRKGKGLTPMHIYQPIAYGAGLLGPGAYRPPVFGGPLPVSAYGHSMLIPYGKGGLLSPTGGAVSHRKGHYRYTKYGKRVHVKPTIVHTGGRLRRARRRY